MFLIKKGENNVILSSMSRECKASFNASASSEESHNFLCSTLAGEPKSMISIGGKISQCCRLLRHFVMKTSHLKINVPHNDMNFLHVITQAEQSAEQPAEKIGCLQDQSAGSESRLMRGAENKEHGLKQSDVVISNTGTTLTQTLSLSKGRGSKIKEILNQVQNDYYKIAAFTLAEALITLGIIGIVAAMTIPTLMQKYYEKQTVNRLKETYSILTQALKLCGEENGYPEEWGITGRNDESTAIIAEKIIPYLKINIDCGMKMGKSDKCFPKTTQRLNGSKKTNTKEDSKYYVSLLNGTSLAIESAEIEADMYLYFLIDTNGAAPPNTWGKDIFEFTYRPILGLVPSGHPGNSSNTYKTTCRDIGDYGWGCAYYVINFGDMEYLHRKPEADSE